MNIKLVRGTDEDAKNLYDIQVKAFESLLKKYEDYDISPAKETIEYTIGRINYPFGVYYKIIFEEKLIGGIRIQWWNNRTCYRISPIFILPEYQNRGIGREVINKVEKIYVRALTWELETILEEEKNCNFYERLGYRKTGESKKINSKTTIVFYKKYM